MWRSLWAVIILAMAGTAASAAEGLPDPSWGNNGSLRIDVSPGGDIGKTLLIQRDGKLLLGGTCFPNDSTTFCATRLRPDGSYAPGFGSDGLGYVTFTDFPGFPDRAHLGATALTANGGSVFAGDDFSATGLIAKLTSAGALDPGAGAGAGWRRFHFSTLPVNPVTLVRAIAVQADGKIVVVGTARRNNQANDDFGIARFLPNLDFDVGFGDGGRILVPFDLEGPSGENYDQASAVAIQADGKIVVAGSAQNDSETFEVALIRLTVGGQLDPTFGDGGRAHFAWGAISGATAVTVDRDGSLLVAGAVVVAEVSGGDFAVNRLRPNGSQDPSFGPQCPSPSCQPGPVFIDLGAGPALGGTQLDAVDAIAVQTDGRIVLAGGSRLSETEVVYAVARVMRNGGLDPSFGDGGVSGGHYGTNHLTSVADAVAIGNGGIMLAGLSGGASENRFGVARLSLDLIHTDGFQVAYAVEDAIVVVDDVNLAVPQTVVGASIEWGSGMTCLCDGLPNDFNLYSAGSNLTYVWPGSNGAGVAAAGAYSVLQSGAVIGPSSSFSFSSNTNNWRQPAGVDGYIGFRFRVPYTGQTNYGYARITTTGTTGFPAMLHSYAYNRYGEPITIP